MGGGPPRRAPTGFLRPALSARENHILRYFLWAVVPLLLLAARVLGIAWLFQGGHVRAPPWSRCLARNAASEAQGGPAAGDAAPRPVCRRGRSAPREAVRGGQRRSIEGGDAGWTLKVAEPDGQARVTLVATLAGYETLVEELQPKPGESRRLARKPQGFRG